MYNIWYNYICMYSWLWLSHPPQKRESHVESSSNLLGCKTNHRLYKDGVNAFTFTIFHNVMCNVPKIIGYNPTVFVKHEKNSLLDNYFKRPTRYPDTAVLHLGSPNHPRPAHVNDLQGSQANPHLQRADLNRIWVGAINDTSIQG